VLVERDHVLTALRELSGDAAGGAGRPVFLGNETGVGKTALGGALTAAVPEGIVVRRGACDSFATAEALGGPVTLDDSARRRSANPGRLRRALPALLGWLSRRTRSSA
jgi:MoxR-like ATPase